MHINSGMFRIARLASQMSEFDQRYKVGAVISRHGKPLAIGCNKLKTHASYPEAYSIHAEIAAIMRVKYTENTTLWVYRETSDGKPGIAKPCHLCMPVIIEAGIKRIYYSILEYPYWEIIKL